MKHLTIKGSYKNNINLLLREIKTKLAILINRHEEHLVFGLFILAWLTAPLLVGDNSTTGMVDPGIWQLILLALISFMVVVGLAWWLLRRFWMVMALPSVHNMVLLFKTLESWQQIGLYWASFALLLLAAVGCLTAIC